MPKRRSDTNLLVPWEVVVRLFRLAARSRLSLSLPLSFCPSSYFLSFSIQKWIHPFTIEVALLYVFSLSNSLFFTANWAAIPTHTSRVVSVLHNSRCWKKPSVFACLSTFARKINTAAWWSSPRACPSKIRTKSTMVWKEKIDLSRSGGERTR